jgi:D-amino peptidase
MRILISVDIEGVAGVVHPEPTRRGKADYERARHWMTAEAKARSAAHSQGVPSASP